MAKVYNKALNRTIEVERIIGKIKGHTSGPTLVVFAGIHGNETSGIFALKDLLNNLKPEIVNGTIYGIAGNLSALDKHQRYVDEDLNRLWTKSNIEAIKQKSVHSNDENELLELLEVLEAILNTRTPPFYFIDLHTTSSKTLPFITINDALINRKFSKHFPVPIVLGIEEYLTGPLLSYINQLGYVSLGFEAGQHDDINAIINNTSFLNLVLVYTGILSKKWVPDFDNYYTSLKLRAKNAHHFLEIIHLHKIRATDSFKMLRGFKSFQAIKKGVPLAVNNGLNIFSKYNGLIFMPLYQSKGSEGFFIARVIAPFFLKLSTLLRRFKFDNLLVALPGISWINKLEGTLKVNLKVTKYFAKSIFHLLGYRNRYADQTHLKLNNRERVAKTFMYKNEVWFH